MAETIGKRFDPEVMTGHLSALSSPKELLHGSLNCFIAASMAETMRLANARSLGRVLQRYPCWARSSDYTRHEMIDTLNIRLYQTSSPFVFVSLS